jgi:hypothetical protein
MSDEQNNCELRVDVEIVKAPLKPCILAGFEGKVKALIFVFVLCFFDGLMLRAEEASPGKAGFNQSRIFRKDTK